MRWAPTFAAVTICLAAAGCGSAAARPAAVAEQFHAAAAHGRANEACRLLTESARETLEEEESKPCPQALEEVKLPDPGPLTVQAFISSAIASSADGTTAFLEETPNGWRVAAAGCEPHPEEPYDCELEG